MSCLTLSLELKDAMHKICFLSSKTGTKRRRCTQRHDMILDIVMDYRLMHPISTPQYPAIEPIRHQNTDTLLTV